jgi:hypothetical protein
MAVVLRKKPVKLLFNVLGDNKNGSCNEKKPVNPYPANVENMVSS